MKREERLKKAFGVNEAGLADLPVKISGTQITRILRGHEQGCTECFPHGRETINSHWHNYQRSWKKQRRRQWR